MAVTFNSYTGLKAAIPAYLARAVGGADPILDPQFDNFLLNCETRIYYGYEDPTGQLQSDPLRVPEMETVDSAFSLSSGTVAQPTNFIELISAYNSSINSPMEIVAQRVIDGYGAQAVGGAKLIAVSGTNFRIKDAPTTTPSVAVLRSYQKLTTPTAAASNAILTNYPHVYLYGCLIEAAVFTQDPSSAQAYLAVYNAAVSGLNARTQRMTASANPVMRVRGMTP